MNSRRRATTKTEQGAGRPARAPRAIDAGWVEWAVAEHLARYSSTRSHLETLLKARVRRAAHKGAPVPENIREILATVLDRHVELGTLNDAAWAEMKARSLTRRGVASAVVKQRLRQKGVPDATTAMETVAEELRGPAVDGEEREEVATDLIAACAWARRKRVGAFARDAADPEDTPEPTDRGQARAARDAARAAEQKLLASMARAGFPFAIARRVLQMSLEEADELLLRMR
ncbi:MAG: RecX family transcriptional regulator [Pseudomonadota bacterium]|nr:RecX family transcriptional regulator [Pseudomonadota bacterium]